VLQKDAQNGRFPTGFTIPKPLENQGVANQFIIPLFDLKRKRFFLFSSIFLMVFSLFSLLSGKKESGSAVA